MIGPMLSAVAIRTLSLPICLKIRTVLTLIRHHEGEQQLKWSKIISQQCLSFQILHVLHLLSKITTGSDLSRFLFVVCCPLCISAGINQTLLRWVPSQEGHESGPSTPHHRPLRLGDEDARYMWPEIGCCLQEQEDVTTSNIYTQ